MNVPIPPVFLYEWDLSRYEVMDGQQRLNSIVDFYGNRFALKGLEKWQELNGSRYGDLPETLQRGLDRRRISVTVLLLSGRGRPGQRRCPQARSNNSTPGTAPERTDCGTASTLAHSMTS